MSDHKSVILQADPGLSAGLGAAVNNPVIPVVLTQAPGPLRLVPRVVADARRGAIELPPLACQSARRSLWSRPSKNRPMHARVTAMAKIKVANPVVELDVELKHYDFGMESRDALTSVRQDRL